jgi:phosphoribosyl 1,2-cyclic phosphate phosphodiesterase
MWTLVITGCGTSHLNPLWGRPAQWSTDPRDRRRRSGAALLGPAGQVVLIDAGPDLAHQCTDPFRDWDGVSFPARSLDRCDALLLTHDHADHAHGLNELRHLNRLMGGGQIPILGHPSHLAEIQRMFPYAFGAGEDAYRMARPALTVRPLSDGQPIEVAGLTVTMVPMSHGPAGRTSGFRCGGMAYLTDLKDLPRSADRFLGGLDLLVLDMLRDEPHPTHLCWAEAEAIIARLAPRRTVLTHMGPEVRYADWEHRLPRGVVMAVDGWSAPFPA